METMSFLGRLADRKGKAYHDLVAEFCQRMLDICDEKTGDRKVVEMRDSCSRFIMELESRMDRGGGIQGIATGWGRYDELTGGLLPCQLVVVAGRPSMGKSALAYNWIANMAKRGISHLVFSGEASDQQISHRLLTRESMVESDKVRSGNFSGQELEKTYSAIGRVASWPISCVEAPFSDLDIVIKSRRFQRDVIWVDHLALVNASDRNSNKAVEVGNITRRLKLLAVELKKPVVLLCQLNREIEKENRDPRLSDLRDSGSIEQDADVILFVGVDKKKNKNADHADAHRKMILAKQRDGDVGVWQMEFLRQFQHFQRIGRDY
jgi:replicative DNA helicase